MIIAGALLGMQAAVVVFSLSGHGIFANNPELLLRFDPEGKFFLWCRLDCRYFSRGQLESSVEDLPRYALCALRYAGHG